MTSLYRIPTLFVAMVLIHAGLGTDSFGQEAKVATVSMQQVDDIQNELDSEARRMALTDVEWKAFGDRVTDALESENAGVQRSALRLAVHYGDKLQMGRRAAINAVRLYREHPDHNVRKMAVVAIARINHPWGIDFLARSLEFEDSTDIERTMKHALHEEAPAKKQ